jgi:hypothetical protein
LIKIHKAKKRIPGKTANIYHKNTQYRVVEHPANKTTNIAKSRYSILGLSESSYPAGIPDAPEYHAEEMSRSNDHQTISPGSGILSRLAKNAATGTPFPFPP